MKEIIKQIAINYGLSITTGVISALASYVAINIKTLTRNIKKEKNNNNRLLAYALEVLNQLIYIVIFALQQKTLEDLKNELDSSNIPNKGKDGEEIVIEFIREKVKEQMTDEMRDLFEKQLGDIDEYIDKRIEIQLKTNKHM